VENPPAVSRFIINFCCKDLLIGILSSCCHRPVYDSSDAETVSCLLEELFSNSAVDGCTRTTPFPTLIMSEYIFWDNSSEFVDRILLHNVHWSHLLPFDLHHAFKRDRKAVAVFDVLANELL